MRKLLLLFFYLFLSLPLFAQAIYEAGHYVDNEGKTHEGLIRNQDWRSNPVEFRFKSTELAEVQILSINEASEFEIYAYGKFVRKTIEIDRSSDDKTKLSTSRTPEFSEETLFLKTLFEGAASLYSYQEGNLQRFFYKKDDSNLEQLIYRLYQVRVNMITDNSFRDQLRNSFTCESINNFDYGSIEYNRKDLLTYFITYSSCKNNPGKQYSYSRDYETFRITIKPALNYASLEVSRTGRNQFFTQKITAVFDKSITYSLGVELEAIFPFDNGKWSAILEPTFQYFEANTTYPVGQTDRPVSIDYKSIDLPLGIRYRKFITPKTELFINPLVAFSIPINSSLEFNLTEVDIVASPNFMIGVGARMNRIMTEVRYSFKREIFKDQTTNLYLFTSNYEFLSLRFGYSL